MARVLKDLRWLFTCLVLLATGCNADVTRVDIEAARPFTQSYWDSLRANDVPKAMEAYDASVWKTADRSLWSVLLRDLGQQFGSVASADLTDTEWVPGSSLVADHRPFICYVYDFNVRRDKLGTRERLIVCGEPDAATEDLRIYGHQLQRVDTEQSVGIGVAIDDKARE